MSYSTDNQQMPAILIIVFSYPLVRNTLVLKILFSNSLCQSIRVLYINHFSSYPKVILLLKCASLCIQECVALPGKIMIQCRFMFLFEYDIIMEHLQCASFSHLRAKDEMDAPYLYKILVHFQYASHKKHFINFSIFS